MPRLPAPVRSRRADERRYLAALRQLLDPALIGLLQRLAQVGAYSEALRVLDGDLPENIPGLVPLVQDQLESIDRYHRWRTVAALGRALGVDIRPFLAQATISAFMRGRVEENVSLIRTIEPRLRAALRNDILRLQAEAPFDRAALRRVLSRDYRVAGYNLRRITRDQNNKLIGQLTEIRQQQLGISSYVWRTSEDERVRPTHVAKNGRRFRWDEPPADTGHPGQDIQCRCVAQAILPAQLPVTR